MLRQLRSLARNGAALKIGGGMPVGKMHRECCQEELEMSLLSCPSAGNGINNAPAVTLEVCGETRAGELPDGLLIESSQSVLK